MGDGKCSRRRFIKSGAVGAAALSVWSGSAAAAVFGAPTGSTERRPEGSPSPQARTLIPAFSLGAASYTFREFGLDEAVAMTKRVGLDRICLKDLHLPLQSPEAEVMAVARGIRRAGIIPYACGVVYMTTAEEVDRAFTYAWDAGMEMIVGVPNHDLLPHVQKRVAETGIMVAIHNHGPGDRLYPTPKSVYDRVKNLDPRIGLCLDVGHCRRSGLDPSDEAEAWARRLLDLHLKDVTAASAEGGPVEAGRGVIDLPRLLRTLVQVGFRGTASFEYEKDGRDPLPGLAESVGYVRGILAARRSSGLPWGTENKGSTPGAGRKRA